MAEREYRIYVQSTDIIGHQFLEDCVAVAKLGAELDNSQTRMAFPHNSVFFLKTDKTFENTPTTTFTLLTQLFTSEEELDALSFDTFRAEMKKVGIKVRERAVANAEYMAKFMPEKAKAVESTETPLEGVKEEEVSLPPTEVIQEAVEAPVQVTEEGKVVEVASEEKVKEPEVVPEVTVTKKRGPKGK